MISKVTYTLKCETCGVEKQGETRESKVYHNEGPGSDDLPKEWELIGGKLECDKCRKKRIKHTSAVVVNNL